MKLSVLRFRQLFATGLLLTASVVVPLQSLQAAPQTQDAVTPAWTVTGQSDYDGIGEVLAVGDLNGDGFDELIVGGSEMVVYFGSADGLALEPALVNDDLADAPYLTSSVSAFDVNGDGAEELVLGAPFQDDGGRAYVYFGDDKSDDQPWYVFGNEDAMQVGYSVDGGDVNGDGFGDLFVGMPNDFGVIGAGNVLVYFGTDERLPDPAEPSQFLNIDDGERFGDWVRSAGDVNNDGYTDLLVHGDQADDPVVFVVRGSEEGLITGDAQVLQPESGDFIFGESAEGVGDINGDGFDDVIVEADSINDVLKAYIYFGNEDGVDLGYSRLILDNPGDHEIIVRSAGDVNADGLADVAIGQVMSPYREEGESTVYIYAGTEDGLSDEPLYTLSSGEELDGFGTDMVAADVNGDGVSEIFVGAPNSADGGEAAGKIYAFNFGTEFALSGMTSDAGWLPLATQILVRAAGEAYGLPAGSVGDLNGDGFDDLVVNSFGNPQREMLADARLFLGSENGLVDFFTLNPGEALNILTERADPDAPAIGFSANGIGDVNGDGFADMSMMVIDAGTEEFTPVMMILHGSEGGIGSELDRVLALPDIIDLANLIVDEEVANSELEEGLPTEELYFGYRTFSAGDLNGDGFGDLIVLSRAQDDDSTLLISIYHGSAEGVADEAFRHMIVPMFSIFGGPVDTADFDQDGFTDLALARNVDDQSQIEIYLGGPNGLTDEPVWTELPETDTLDSGTDFQILSLAANTDLDGDGAQDFVVTALVGENSSVLLAYLSGADGLPDSIGQEIAMSGDDELIHNAQAVTIGDINGDGFDDLLLSTFVLVDERFVWNLHFGGEEGIVEEAAFTFGGNGVSDEFPQPPIFASGDFNSDGYQDLPAGRVDLNAVDQGIAYGEMLVHFGGEGAGPTPVRSEAAAIPEIASADVLAEELSLLSTFALDEGDVLHSISPNGRWMLVYRTDEELEQELLCALDREDESSSYCLMQEMDIPLPLPGFIDWSPDSQAIVFSESPQYEMDTDLWYMDPAEETLINLTNDNSLEVLDSRAMPLPSDLLSAWSPDGFSLAFLRAFRAGSDVLDVGIYGLSLGDLHVQQLSFGRPYPEDELPTGLHWMPDGQSLLYFLEDSERSLWHLPLADAQPEKVAEFPDEAGNLGIWTISPSGNVALISIASNSQFLGLSFALLDLETLELTHLSTEEERVFAAALSPDGSKLALLTDQTGEAGDQESDEPVELSIIVRDIDNGSQSVLFTVDGQMDKSRESLVRYNIGWTETDVIWAHYLVDEEPVDMLLEVGVE